MPRILVIEDHEEMGGLITLLLKEAGFESDWAKTLADADALLKKERYALVTLDVHLPDGDGFEYCARLARRKLGAPIVLLTTEISAESVERGFASGADDYLKKPIDEKELRARLRGHLRRLDAARSTIEFEGAVLDVDRRTVHFKGRRLELKGKQFDLLVALLKRPEVVVTREQLIESLGRDSEIFDRTIDSHVSQLRKKLKDQGLTAFTISSVYGVGYRIE